LHNKNISREVTNQCFDVNIGEIKNVSRLGSEDGPKCNKNN